MRGADQRLVLGLGAVTGVGLALRGLSPTGSTVVDWILLVLAGTGVVWASASAPWWALSGMATVAAVLAPSVAPLLIGVGVFALSLAVGATMRSQPVERAAIAGGAMLVLSMARELGWWGINSLVAIVLVVAVAVLGVSRRSRSDRRIAWYVAAGAAAVAAVGGLGLVAAAAAARPDLSEGNRMARQGLQELKAGEFDLAQASFQRAMGAFERADDDLGALWAQPSRLLPIASQHRRAGTELASAAASTTATIQQQLRLVDLDALRIVGGRVDVDAVSGLRAPMAELQEALGELEVAVAVADNGWLVNRVQQELAELRAEIDEQQDLGEKANAALEVAPAILGAEGERVYFVMFTTPAEARGQGGFMGNYAELTVDNGHIEMTAFGRHTDLNAGLEHPVKLENAPDDWLARYGPFGFSKGQEGVVGNFPWSNITMSPHFPSTAQVVAELYPKSGGRAIDGVISIDVFVMEAIVGLVGPLPIEGTDVLLDGENTAEFLLLDQYVVLPDVAERVDMLETVAREVTTRVLSGTPDPFELGKALAPLARERRIYAWSTGPAEERLFDDVGIAGSIEPTAGEHVLGLVVNNAGGSKLDTFLGTDIEQLSGDDRPVYRFTLTNAAPATGYPDYVIGNAFGLPPGSSRLWVTVVTSAPVRSATLDGEKVRLQAGREAEMFTFAAYVEIAPSSQIVIDVELERALTQVVERTRLTQPLATTSESFGGRES